MTAASTFSQRLRSLVGPQFLKPLCTLQLVQLLGFCIGAAGSWQLGSGTGVSLCSVYARDSS